MRPTLLTIAAAATLAAATSPIGGATAQQAPPGWTGELWPRGGLADSNSGGQTGAGLFDGAVTLPLGAGFTAKGEAQTSALGGADSNGGKLQLWWQDPALGLLGVIAETARSDGLWQRRYIAQGELYLGPFTLRTQAGYVPGDREGNRGLEGGLFGLASGGWYPLDALGLNLGGATQAGKGAGFGNIEWAPAFMPPGSSFTADGAGGADGFLLAVVGVRFTFGPGAGGPVRQRQVGSAPGFPSLLVGPFGTRNLTPPATRDSNSF